MNYRYKVDGEDIIVSQDENDRIKDEIKSGKSVVYLRNDELAINVNFIRLIRETEQLTDEQEKQNDERLKLRAPQWIEPSEESKNKSMKVHEDFFKRMKWDWAESKLNPANRIKRIPPSVMANNSF
jgi:hypothetical protein